VPENKEDLVDKDILLTMVYKNGRYWLYQGQEHKDLLINPAEQAWIVLK
jgi:hypothetical protein